MAHDVLVLGATVAGLTAARRLAEVGYDVVVLDPNPEGMSAAIGHGIAGVGHASTIANMAHAYGIPAAREHVMRNIEGCGRSPGSPTT
ncbi:FAD-binding protein [Tessaracoccus sp. HDW20]|uniref:FAD-binding protein n=1 Tax=Tessaracoccus coleopterorum TaxID=2714950 RepID=UPI0018D3ECE6|nr:FAD-binding protein [Tessaracoccus coleopterorum]NHB84382.1 FAD-binding protein [Tessaracoccus coleopterorum]